MQGTFVQVKQPTELAALTLITYSYIVLNEYS